MAIADRFRQLLTRATGPAPAAASSAPMSTLAPWGNQWPLGGSRYAAENFATVASCVQAIAGSISALPAVVHQVDGKKRIEAPLHPVSRLIRSPNDLQTWPDWLEWLIASMLLYGNAITVIDRDDADRPTALYPIPWWACQPVLTSASPEGNAYGSPAVPDARLVFDITSTVIPFALPSRPTGFPVRYFAEDVVFLRDRSDDGILGRSRLSRSPDALACALGGQSFSTGLWTNGAVLNGVVTHPGKLSNEASQRIAQSWKDTHSGAGNAGKLAVFEEGMKFDKVGVSPEDAELLESRRFSVVEIARLFNIPPSIIGHMEGSTFGTAAQADAWFATHCLLPIINKIEREFSRSVFSSSEFELHIDYSARLRGDYASMMSSNVQAVRSGIMTANEARQEAGLDPHPDGDALVAQAVGGRPADTADGQGDAMPALEPGRQAA